jgi:hypothetical protein
MGADDAAAGVAAAPAFRLRGNRDELSHARLPRWLRRVLPRRWPGWAGQQQVVAGRRRRTPLSPLLWRSSARDGGTRGQSSTAPEPLGSTGAAPSPHLDVGHRSSGFLRLQAQMQRPSWPGVRRQPWSPAGAPHDSHTPLAGHTEGHATTTRAGPRRDGSVWVSGRWRSGEGRSAAVIGHHRRRLTGRSMGTSRKRTNPGGGRSAPYLRPRWGRCVLGALRGGARRRTGYCGGREPFPQGRAEGPQNRQPSLIASAHALALAPRGMQVRLVVVPGPVIVLAALALCLRSARGGPKARLCGS